VRWFLFGGLGISMTAMDMGFWEKRLKDCWDGMGPFWERGALRLAAGFYSTGVRARGAVYSLGLKRSHRVPVPVVSVGNITLGGSGKTPMVEWLVKSLQELDIPVAVVGRGYKRDNEEKTLVVSQWGEALVSVDEGGDEPIMLAKALPRASVVVAARRVEGAWVAVRELGAQLIVLDDGFQHWALARDLDVVLVDGEKGFGNSCLFPAGPLREPLGSLARAHILVLTKRDNPALGKVIGDIAPDVPLFAAPLEVRRIYAPKDGVELTLDDMGNLDAGAFAGIAFPESFFKLLKDLGVNLKEMKAYPDHHFYSCNDLKDLALMACRREVLFTTEKDWTRLEAVDLDFSPFVVKVALKPPHELSKMIRERLALFPKGS
jgi:tetraacyldisaccharide 4'-kinase